MFLKSILDTSQSIPDGLSFPAFPQRCRCFGRAFLWQHSRAGPHNPAVYDHASFIRSRNSTMQEMQRYASSLKITKAPADPSDSSFFALQHWYPRIWDEWARDKDGASPADVYGR